MERMTKNWTVSRGPIVASQIDIQKADAINALLARPVGILPGRPGDLIRPFAIGLFEEIRPLLKPGVGMTTLRRAVAAFVHSKRYYFASAQPDSVRHDLDGRPLEALSEDDRMTAQNRFLRLKQKAAGSERNSEPSSPSPSPTPGATKSEQIRASLLGRGKMQHTSSTMS
ncbi:sRNA-binding protein [Rhizobium binae]|uniref:SRNA-binding protein n=2 Tax=Rhizobium/Agrobacterium group TaxID=227290 RepID=A0ABV2MMZ5_9HYPH